MNGKATFLLPGYFCSCTLSEAVITITGNYYRYDLHKRRRVSGTVTVDLLNVLRVGLTKTYSRLVFLFPMCFGFAALSIRALPSVGYEKEIIEDVYSVGFTLWNVPFQETAWKLCAVLCLLTIPLYWLSYHNDLEINTTKGRFLLPRKGMKAQDIANFQQAFSALKAERLKASKT
ncbi:hypothetical protein H8S11_07090 [Flintibacter sp. NSJ-23]|uniref:Uncharacterized protein n=1 Tax=Flintibacter hominis TaxID=2763048 RepID=A0A8J6M709_9FIRM|nr:hypothetical protein [Flintibacter hominis]MBC5722573.1 hypothetical protein [Flintibacter hominis]